MWLERRWGRIGSSGQKKVERPQEEADLLKRMNALAHQKQRRGYRRK
jgi:predicted DNA-binding WGR domain protein